MKEQKGEFDNIDCGFMEDQNSNKSTFKYKLELFNIPVKTWSLSFFAEYISVQHFPEDCMFTLYFIVVTDLFSFLFVKINLGNPY